LSKAVNKKQKFKYPSNHEWINKLIHRCNEMRRNILSTHAASWMNQKQYAQQKKLISA
jgi:hypothetical protein